MKVFLSSQHGIALLVVPSAPRGGRGGYRGGRGAYRGRKLAPPSVVALDKRPRTLLISGVSVNDKDALLAHMEVESNGIMSFFHILKALQTFGAISSVDFDGKDGGLRAHITYRNRRDAETVGECMKHATMCHVQAKETAGEVNGHKLELQWDAPSIASVAVPDSERPPDKRLSASQILQSLGDEDEVKRTCTIAKVTKTHTAAIGRREAGASFCWRR